MGASYAYNAANRLERLTIGAVLKAEYLYNAFGQQVSRKLYGPAQTIHSVHDMAGNRIAEFDYNPTTHAVTLLREYIWMDGRAVGVIEGGNLFFVRTDWIGRPSFATDSAGTKVWEATYLPFGGVHTSTGTPLELRFPGQWFQSESGLHQNWMRDYDPTTGRYIQADPLGLVDGASVYNYVRQNPGRYVDPRGEKIQWKFLGGDACNFSSQCVVIWTDNESGAGSSNGLFVLAPGQCTQMTHPDEADVADFMYHKGDWYKCRAAGTCYAFDYGVAQQGWVLPTGDKLPYRFEEPDKWHPGKAPHNLTDEAESMIEECEQCQ